VEEASRKDEPVEDVSVNGMEDEHSIKNQKSKVAGSSKSSRQVDYAPLTPQQSYIQVSPPTSPSIPMLQPLNSETQMAELTNYPSSPDLVPAYDPPNSVSGDASPRDPEAEPFIQPEDGLKSTPPDNDSSGNYTPALGTPEKSPSISREGGDENNLHQNGISHIPYNSHSSTVHQPSLPSSSHPSYSISQPSAFRFTQSMIQHQPSQPTIVPTITPSPPQPPTLPLGWSGSSPTYRGPPSLPSVPPQPPPLPIASFAPIPPPLPFSQPPQPPPRPQPPPLPQPLEG
jgi:hypothetical protein